MLWLQTSPEIPIRAIWALVIIATGIGSYLLLNRVVLARAQHGNDARLPDLPYQLDGRTTILYFTTPECVPCKTIQRPALQRVQETLGDRLQVVEVDAVEHPDLANRYGVLSVPTTFVIDARGQLRHVNHGATRAEKLLRQVETITV
jgi:thiol-disulfide isomerase/thioredoxin